MWQYGIVAFLFLVPLTLFGAPPKADRVTKLRIRMNVLHDGTLEVQRGNPKKGDPWKLLDPKFVNEKPGSVLRPEERDYFKRKIQGKTPWYPKPAETEELEDIAGELQPKPPADTTKSKRLLVPLPGLLPGTLPSAPRLKILSTPAASPVPTRLTAPRPTLTTGERTNILVGGQPLKPPPPQLRPFVTVPTPCLGDSSRGPGARSCTFLQAARPVAAAGAALVLTGAAAAGSIPVAATAATGVLIRRLVPATIGSLAPAAVPVLAGAR